MTAPTFPPAQLPTGTDRARIADQIDAWIGSPAMTALRKAFGDAPARDGKLADRLVELEQFSAEHWNFRNGNERHEARRQSFAFEALIWSAAAALGLTGRQAVLDRSYDHMLVLGGGVGHMMARSTLAAEVIASGVSAGSIAGLGSLRPLDKPDVGHKWGLRDCPTEGDAVDESLRLLFRLDEPTQRRSGVTDLGAEWWVRSYHDVSPPVHILAAPRTPPAPRANTGDTLTGWAELVQRSPSGSVLLVTTDVFVPFQHCDAVRLLGLRHGCVVQTVGCDSLTNRYIVTPSEPTTALQEIRSAIRSMQALHSAL